MKNENHPQPRYAYTTPPGITSEQMEDHVRYTQRGDRELVKRIQEAIQNGLTDPRATEDKKILRILEKAFFASGN